MAKGDTLKSLLTLLGIVIFAVFIVNLNKFIPQKEVNNAEESAALGIGGAEESAALGSGQDVKDYGECFSESPDTVVFVHSNSCPHCRTMFPIVEELEEEGYKFYWAEGSDSAAREVIGTCFSDIVGGYVPQFICPKTGKEKTGAMSKSELIKFSDECS